MYAELKESKILGLEEMDEFAKTQITLAQGQCAFMKDKTASDFSSYIASKLMLAKQKKALSPLPTAEEFWEAAHTYNPLTSLGSRNETPLVIILGHARRMDAIPLGNLYGNTAAVLVPSASSLPLSDISEKNFTSFHFADTDSGAITYPDGHPSEDYDQGGSHFDIIVKPNEDNKLRRFCSLGWVAIDIGMDQWEKTGHILVIDVDRDRGHHPWFVLASSWPSDNGEDLHGDFELHAERSAVRGQEGVLGVLPGDSTRTPIAKLIHIGDAPKDSTKPFLKQLDPDSNFTLQRRGGIGLPSEPNTIQIWRI